MPVYKDKNGTWYASYYVKDYQGKSVRKKKRGFKKKKDAEKYIAEQMLVSSNSLEMKFSTFVEIYFDDIKNRVKLNTLQTKHTIIDKKILPFFGDIKVCDISVTTVHKWQNQLLSYRDEDDEGYSPVYLKTIHNQLSAIFNHAIRFYNHDENPARKAGNMGKETAEEVEIWTKEEYMKFSKCMMKKDGVYQAFELLYWLGLRMGEMLALTAKDFDFKNNTVSITKSYQRINGEDIITDPKTKNSVRVVQMPQFLSEEIQDYINRFYGLKETDRLFIISKSKLHHEMDRGCREAGLKRVKVHALRHSAISNLIKMGFSAVEVAKRVGHESIYITYRYAHVFPSVDKAMAKKLDDFRGGAFDESEDFGS